MYGKIVHGLRDMRNVDAIRLALEAPNEKRVLSIMNDGRIVFSDDARDSDVLAAANADHQYGLLVALSVEIGRLRHELDQIRTRMP